MALISRVDTEANYNLSDPWYFGYMLINLEDYIESYTI